MTVFEIVRNAMLAGFGVQEKVTEFVNDLVAKGELNDSQGAKLVKEWSAKAEKTSDEFNKSVSELTGSAAAKMNVATKDDLDKLARKVQTLSTRIKKLEEAATGKEAS